MHPTYSIYLFLRANMKSLHVYMYIRASIRCTLAVYKMVRQHDDSRTTRNTNVKVEGGDSINRTRQGEETPKRITASFALV